MFVVICYDIPDNERRNRLSKVLEGFGRRVQKSVFECDLTPRQYQVLRRRLARIYKPDDDLIRFYTLCQVCNQRIETIGSGDVEKTPPLYVV